MIKAISQLWNTRIRSTIELASKHDHEGLSEIHTLSFSRGWSDGEFDALLRQEPFFCLIERKVGKSRKDPSGFVLVKQTHDEAEIITLAVTPADRRRGVAERLMNEAIRRLQADRVNTLFLEVDEVNAPAVALYKKLGFSVMDKRDGYYSASASGDRKPSVALVMRLELG